MRLLDVVLALVVLGVFAPLWAVIAGLIRFTSPGPVFYRARAIGLNGREFALYKFRTMSHGGDDSGHRDAIARFVRGEALAEEEGGGKVRRLYKQTRDPRITPVGRWLRRSGLDEVPQFLNVLRGEMAIVGPRPPTYYEYALYSEAHRRRLDVRPGITGLYQVTARSMVSFEEMVAIDLDYIARRSVWLDLWIIVRTPWAMLTGRGAY